MPQLEDQGALVDDKEADEIQFQIEPCALQDDSSHSLQLEPTYSLTQVMINDSAEKLDIMMTLCLEYILTTCYDNGTVHAGS